MDLNKIKIFFKDRLNQLKNINPGSIRRFFKERIFSWEKRYTNLLILFILVNTIKLVFFYFSIINVPNMKAVNKVLDIFAYAGLYFLPLLLLRRRALFIIFFLIQNVFVLTNFLYYSYHHGYVNFILQIGLWRESLATVLSGNVPWPASWPLLFLDLPFFILLLWVYPLVNRAYLQAKGKRWALFFLLFAAVMSGTQYNDEPITELLRRQSTGEEKIVLFYGLVVNNILTYAKQSNEKDLIAKFRYGKNISGNKSAPVPPNIILLQVETLDAHVIQKSHQGEKIMPYLSKLALDSIYYPFLIHYHYICGSACAEFSIVNSIEPLVHFPSLNLKTYKHPNSMIKIFRDNGYYTMGFHANFGYFYNRNITYKRMGYHEFLDGYDLKLEHKGYGSRDKEFLLKSFNYIKEMDSNKQPYLTYLITISSHTAFWQVKHYYSNNIFNEIKDKRSKNYLLSMNYVDTALQAFMEKVETLSEPVMVLIFGDHSSGIFTDYHKDSSIKHKYRKIEYTPLIIVHPQGRKYREKKRIVCLQDIAPTLLNACIGEYEYRSDGVDLLDRDNKKFPAVPYQGYTFDRELLFQLVNKTFLSKVLD